jgi:Fur family peroxide stress response transcriptional regulator
MTMERKHSAKRDAILAVIQSTVSHPSAQWVYTKLKGIIPNLSLGTVYRNISLFREEGTVISVGVVNGEERFDGQTAPHPHFVCSFCGKIVDLPRPDEGVLKRLAESGTGRELPDCAIDYRKTVFYGAFRECAGS